MNPERPVQLSIPHRLEECPGWAISPSLTLRGRSRAADRTGFLLCELRLFFDGGLNSYIQPELLALTHTHSDHSFALPMIATGQVRPFPVVCPAEASYCLFNFFRATDLLARCADSDEITQRANRDEITRSESPPLGARHGVSFVGVRPGDTVRVPNREYELQVVALQHSVPTCGYILRHRRQKLMEQYQGLSGREIAELRRSGAETSALVSTPVFAYLCDTHIAAIERLFEAGPPAPFILVECTFVDGIDDSADPVELADAKQHVDWVRLEYIVRLHSTTTFALTHFSSRYSDDDLKRRFSRCPFLPNVLLWLDSGVFRVSELGPPS